MNKKVDFDPAKRDFLKTMGSLAAFGAVTTWMPVQSAKAWIFQHHDRLNNFPSKIRLHKQRYEDVFSMENYLIDQIGRAHV